MNGGKKAPAKHPPLRLRLYIAGNAPNSVEAVANAKSICGEHYAGVHRLEIVDLMDNPAQALADGIIVTPTLIKLSPLPVRKVIGNLSEKGQVLLALGGK